MEGKDDTQGPLARAAGYTPEPWGHLHPHAWTMSPGDRSGWDGEQAAALGRSSLTAVLRIGG